MLHIVNLIKIHVNLIFKNKEKTKIQTGIIEEI